MTFIQDPLRNQDTPRTDLNFVILSFLITCYALRLPWTLNMTNFKTQNNVNILI
jgi:hypothetical protein